MRIEAGLNRKNFEVKTTSTVEAAARQITNNWPDILVLDVYLPDGLGLSLIEQARGKGMGVFCISSMSGLEDRVTALKLGADDYLAKPIANTELAIKLNNLYDRLDRGEPDKPRNLYQFGEYTCDPLAQVVTHVEAGRVDTTPGEFATLLAFVRNAKVALSRERLIQILSSHDKSVNDRAIDIMVYKLRQKLEVAPKKPTLIKTVYGVGYLFDANVQQVEAEPQMG